MATGIPIDVVNQQLADLAQQVRQQPKIRLKAGQSKSALSREANLDLSPLRGILEYQPQEYTISLLAGTRLSEVNEVLAKEGQYLPFDPPLVQAGATIGGSIAAGLSGAGRYRYGGVRDFLLRVRLMMADGSLQTGGAKVVKNAAGFDLPKLMVGSLGCFGILTEATFKVFPKPAFSQSLVIDTSSFSQACELVESLNLSHAELNCLDFEASGKVYLRLAGSFEAAEVRLQRLKERLGKFSMQQLEGSQEEKLWQDINEYHYLPSGYGLAKVPLTLSKAKAFE
ncbi:MAG: FAD-binding protein, partial [Deinococcales bacterium]